ncbi:hypothetical protein AB0F91_43650 [Amycolatopsis sp. NPDC023774]|uniref:hypothetical protein n=1 Tax=Amycolatopsis sp. NPDC023774 TaxID=3155015 RepID=UPI0033FBC1FF
MNRQTLRQALIAPELLSRATATAVQPLPAAAATAPGGEQRDASSCGMQPLGAFAGGLLGAVSLRETLVTDAALMALATASAARLMRIRQL